MSEPAPTPPIHPTAGSTVGQKVGRVAVRCYAFVILLIVLWTGYTAIAYLARYVFKASRVPPEYLDPLASGVSPQPGWKERAPGSGVSTTRPAGFSLEPAISHYHRDPQGFAFVGVAGCTTSGCHTLLPHSQHKESRAFANFHSTFLDCSSCHDSDVHTPATAVWVGNVSGAKQDPPALLRLMMLLESKADLVEKSPSQVSPVILDLLRQAEETVGVDPPLHDLLLQIETSEPGSPMWRQAVSELQKNLPNRVRGEYGARITPAVVADQWVQRQSHLKDLTQEFNAASSGSPQRDQINKQIHEKVIAKPEACLSCHGGEPARFDFAELGYSPQRVATLHSTPIARMIQQIREGRPFHLPTLLERRDGK